MWSLSSRVAWRCSLVCMGFIKTQAASNNLGWDPYIGHQLKWVVTSRYAKLHNVSVKPVICAGLAGHTQSSRWVGRWTPTIRIYWCYCIDAASVQLVLKNLFLKLFCSLTCSLDIVSIIAPFNQCLCHFFTWSLCHLSIVPTASPCSVGSTGATDVHCTWSTLHFTIAPTRSFSMVSV